MKRPGLRESRIELPAALDDRALRQDLDLMVVRAEQLGDELHLHVRGQAEVQDDGTPLP
jgi:hypothetical protein